MRKFRDTPRRYVYREMWGLSAFCALAIIRGLRRCYPQLREELERDRNYFVVALKAARAC